MNPRKGQAFVEYSILLGVVTVVLLGMQLYAKRGIQAGFKMAADGLSPHPNDPRGELAQRDGIRYESRDRQDKAVGSGTVLERNSQNRAIADQTGTSSVATDGAVTTVANEKTTTKGTLDAGGVSDRVKVVTNVN